MHVCHRFINPSGVDSEDFSYLPERFRPGGKCHVLYNSSDKTGNVLSWYAPHSPIWYQKVSHCLSNPADVNLTPESFKGGRSLVIMLFHPFSQDCKLGGFVVLKPLLTDQSNKGFLGLPPFRLSRAR